MIGVERHAHESLLAIIRIVAANTDGDAITGLLCCAAAFGVFIAALWIWDESNKRKQMKRHSQGKRVERRKAYRQLRVGRRTWEVKALLGEPRHIQVEAVNEHWEYSDGGRLTFSGGKLREWDEPRP